MNKIGRKLCQLSMHQQDSTACLISCKLILVVPRSPPTFLGALLVVKMVCSSCTVADLFLEAHYLDYFSISDLRKEL